MSSHRLDSAIDGSRVAGLLDPSSVGIREGSFEKKRAFDVVVSLSILVIVLPLLIAVALAILISEGGPVLFSHRRLGRHGRPFGCLKFRTMKRESDAILRKYLDENDDARIEWQKSRKLKKDPRVTILGRVLRKLSLDEFPQLINVLRGDMSLVGPRPIVEEEVPLYGDQIIYYYSAKPGITGLWQVSGRSDVSYQARVTLDREYVTSSSLIADLRIIAMTIPALVTSKGSY